MKKVSVIIPVYNVEMYIERAIDSAINQTYKNIEIILINDGSTDGSGIICNEYTKKDKRIKVIHQENKGSGLSRNVGIEHANGEYIYFMDPDDYIETSLIEDNIEIAEKNNANLVVFGFFEEREVNKGSINSIEHTFSSYPYIKNEDLQKNFRKFYSFFPRVLWNKLYKKAFLINTEYRFTDQKVGQDAIFNYKIYSNIDKVFFNAKPYYHYIFRENSAVNKYKDKRFDYEYNVANAFEKLILYWGKENEFKNLIFAEYWKSVYVLITNISSKYAPFTYKEKIKFLQNKIRYGKLELVLSKLDIKDNEYNLFNKILIQLIRNRNFKTVLYVMKTKLYVSYKYFNLFSILKKIG